ncbi:iron chelate uptake ABC transporter family permease subunit [Paenibacillus campinasensis]|uniref:Iron chelate uptake ABC transporter family permease subunit n=1 Tax=Paenibacillus campinasensis TaxID=66347 RepID=A0ABW9T9G4_9BACL|nr:iron ABC transporter permease [Paenibacillus campinasensis]MUG69011.1 iron chelate uptake ABC transporter family permease subunit [Paenibacillus campinasensis]
MNTKTFLSGYHQRQRRYYWVSGLLIILLGGLSVANLALGSTVYSLDTIFEVLSGKSVEGASFTLLNLRLPRVVVGLLTGIALGAAGNTFQSLLRNPLASPDIIGITAGSSSAAVFCLLVLNISGGIVSAIALLFGLAVAALIYLLSRGKGFSKGRLILIGIGIQSMLYAVIDYILLKSAPNDLPAAMRWLKGSLNGAQMDRVPLLLVAVVIGVVFILILSRRLQVMQLGDAVAFTLGVNVKVSYILFISLAVCLISFATSVSGPIASVALLSGPIASALVGRSHANTMLAALVGATLVLLADFIGQHAFAIRYPVGVITGLLGAPYLLLLLSKVYRKGGRIS